MRTIGRARRATKPWLDEGGNTLVLREIGDDISVVINQHEGQIDLPLPRDQI
jgi:hypothetical protein